MSKRYSLLVGTALAAAVLSATSSADAGIAFSLRFSDNTTVKTAATGVFTINLFARVSGTDTDHTNDGFQSILGALVSQQTGGGAVANGNVTTSVLVAPFNSGTKGIANSISADTYGDWGLDLADTTSPPSASTENIWERSGVMTFGGVNQGDPTSSQPTRGSAINTTTWEFLIGTFRVSNTVVGTGTSTKIVWSAPWWIANQSGNPAYGVFFSDLPLPTTDSSNNPIDNTGYSAGFDADGTILSNPASGTGGVFGALPSQVVDNSAFGAFVEFTNPVPEPASVGLLALGALSLVARRRRS